MIYDIAPVVSSYSPTGTVSVNSTITVVFNVDIQASEDAIVLLDSDGNRVAGLTTVDKRSLQFKPSSPLNPRSSYRVTVLSNKIKSLLGLPMARDFSYQFVTEDVALEAPLLVYPSDSSSISPDDVRFEWDSVSGAVCYEVQVSSLPNFSNIIWPSSGNSIVSTSVQPDIEFDDGQYYWRVRAVGDTGQKGPWSITSSFVVRPIEELDNNTLDDVTILSVYPADGSVVKTNLNYIYIRLSKAVPLDKVAVQFYGEDILDRDDMGSHGIVRTALQGRNEPDGTFTVIVTLLPGE